MARDPHKSQEFEVGWKLGWIEEEEERSEDEFRDRARLDTSSGKTSTEWQCRDANANGVRAHIRGPPNLHLHDFQRITREWNESPNEASKVQFLFRESRRKKASSELTTMPS